MVLVLVGVQGSGKSTFSNALIARAAEQPTPRRWARVNQDSIAGKPGRGTRGACENLVKASVGAGSSAVVDRMHLTRDQRAYFVKAAREANCQAHCVVLDLPLKTCIQRAVDRTAHEGDILGPMAKSHGALCGGEQRWRTSTRLVLMSWTDEWIDGEE